MEDLAALRVLLQRERDARHELELQSTAATRQLWLLRDKFDREVRQLQDQLSVVRASLILAHRQQQLVKGTPSTADSTGRAFAAAVFVFDEGDDVLQSPQKQWQTPDQASRLTPVGHSRESTPQHKSAVSLQNQPTGSSPLTNALRNPVALRSEHQQLVCHAAVSTEDESAVSPPARNAAACPDQYTNNGITSIPSNVSSSTIATQLLAAAAKLQQLVEQLTHREPSVAADLSVLQWQLTAAYGHLTEASRCNSSRSICDVYTGPTASRSAATAGADVMAEATTETSPATAEQHSEQQQQLTTAASIRDAVLVRTNSDPLTTPVEQATHCALGVEPIAAAERQNTADVAAAAMLFSGAATTLQTSQIHWYYKDDSSIRGPHEPSLMIRWQCSCFLEGSLPVAGVVQQADGSSAAPPDSAFKPLQELLQQVREEGYLYAPSGLLQDHIDASPLPEHLQHAEQEAAEILRPGLPVSTLSRSPVSSFAVADVSHPRISTAQSLSAGGAGQLFSNLVAAFEEESESDAVDDVVGSLEGSLYSVGHTGTASTKVQRGLRLQHQHRMQQEQLQRKHRRHALVKEASSGTQPAEEGWSIAAVSRAAYAALDALEGMGNAVESAVTATVESVINTAESAFAGQLSSSGVAAG